MGSELDILEKAGNSIEMLRSFFTHVPSSVPEVPSDEPPDPAVGRSLSDAYRSARRSLVAVCGLCLAWSTAQFNLQELRIEVGGLAVDLRNASIPLLLGVTLAYLMGRWTMEFAMMQRAIRRWRLAQMDYKIVSWVARFSLLFLTAGALDRSIQTVMWVLAFLASLYVALAFFVFLILMLFTMPVRLRARERAQRPSVAKAAIEALAWAEIFALVLIALGNIALGMAFYWYEPLRSMLVPVPPHPIATMLFILALNFIFVSPWLFQGFFHSLFSERPNYRTKRLPDGSLGITFNHGPNDPLL